MEKAKKTDKVNIILLVIFIVGLSIMMYPIVSDYWNSRTQSRAVSSYSDTVKDIPEDNIDELFSQADKYNKELMMLKSPFTQYDEISGYNDILDISGTGIMGYITIKSINVELPIYHGTSKGVLQIAAGHLEGSSFPTGEKGTHSVFSAHRGLPSSKLFTDLDHLQEGDTFTITVLNKKMTYKIDQIKTVEPNQIDLLKIDPSNEYCTLMTCTPYGINSHRMLVRGRRVEDTESPDTYIDSEAHQVNTTIVGVILAIIMLLMVVIYKFISRAIRKLRR